MGSGKGHSKRVNLFNLSKSKIGLTGYRYTSEETDLLVAAKRYGYHAMFHRYNKFPNDFRLNKIVAKENPIDEFEQGIEITIYNDAMEENTGEKHQIVITSNVIKTTKNNDDTDISAETTFIDKTVVIPISDLSKAHITAAELTNHFNDWAENAQYNIIKLDKFPSPEELTKKIEEKLAFYYFDTATPINNQYNGTSPFVDDEITIADKKLAAERQNELDKLEIDKMKEKIKLREKFITESSPEMLDNYRDDVIEKEELNKLEKKYNSLNDKVWANYRNKRTELSKTANARRPEQEKIHAIKTAKIVRDNRLAGIKRAQSNAKQDGRDLDFTPVFEYIENEYEKIKNS